MVYCFAFGCNHQSLREHCKFFRFPLRDANLLNQWRTACRRADREPNQYDRLCSCHFKDSIKENGPTIFTGVAAAVASGSGSSLRLPSGGLRRKRLRMEPAPPASSVMAPLPNGKVKRAAKESAAAKEEPVVVKKEAPPAPAEQSSRDLIKWQRTLDRIRCLAFREARDAGAAFISVRWVAERLNRSPAFVKKHWRGRYSDCCPAAFPPEAGRPPSAAASCLPPREAVREAAQLRLALPQSAERPEEAGSPSTATGVQTDGLTDDGLQEDWDPILEERNLIQGLLCCAAADKGGGGLDADATLGLDDETSEMLAPRRMVHRGKTTPRTRTDALVEKNEAVVNGLCSNGRAERDEDEEEEEEDEEDEEEGEEEEEENAPLKCGQCGRKFSTTEALERHMSLHGVSVGPFGCHQCGSVFAKRRGLVRHLRVHGGEPRYCCETCGKGFAQRTNLEKHRRLHTGERAYACRLCDRKFMEREHLSSHMLQHSGVRPYGCEFCDKRFKMQCHLVSHLRSHVPPLLASQNASP